MYTTNGWPLPCFDRPAALAGRISKLRCQVRPARGGTSAAGRAAADAAVALALPPGSNVNAAALTAQEAKRGRHIAASAAVSYQPGHITAVPVAFDWLPKTWLRCTQRARWCLCCFCWTCCWLQCVSRWCGCRLPVAMLCLGERCRLYHQHAGCACATAASAAAVLARALRMRAASAPATRLTPRHRSTAGSDTACWFHFVDSAFLGDSRWGVQV